jgi:hypothetical protein
MRFISKSALLALMAVLALGAVAVASASAALPEFQKEGKPLKEAIKFTGTSGTSGWAGVEGNLGASRSSSIAGEFKAPNTIANTELVEKELVNTYPCKCSEMSGKELKGALGYTNTSTKRVGALLEPSTLYFLKALKISQGVLGSVIGEITPVNTSTTKFKITYHDSSGIQLPTHFEGSEVLHQLEVSTSAEILGLESEINIVTSKAIEVKA